MTRSTKQLLAALDKKSKVECTFLEAEKFLRYHKISCVESKLVESPSEAARVARSLGFPVVLKIVSPKVLHKSDYGGVLLGLQDETSVMKGYSRLMALGKRLLPGALEGIAIEHQAPVGPEVIVGALDDRRFGPVVMLGSGGIFVETIRDSTFRLAPIVKAEAEAMIRSLRSYGVLRGERGKKLVDINSLARLLVKVSLLVHERPIAELDLNPVILYEHGFAIVDAKLRLERREPRTRAEMSKESFEALSRIFRPRRVAIIGASPEPGKIGHSALKNIIDGGYKGGVYPINPRYEEILGLRCYKNLRETGEPIDLVVVAVPAALVPPLMKELGEARVAGTIVISSGFSETGNTQLELELVQRARESGVRVIGPNTYGIYVPPADLSAVFTQAFNVKGSVALTSQSGGVGMAMLGYGRSNNLGASAIVGLGNKCDVDEYDLIEYLGRDESTSVIALHAEGIKDGRAILEAAKRVVNIKPVVMLKAGRTPEGMTAASSHTGSLAADPIMVDQLLKSAGILVAQSLGQFFDYIKGLAMLPTPSGENVLIVTGAGGLGVLLCDACVEHGLNLMKPPVDLLDRVKKFVPAFGSLGNPIDITGGQPPETYERVIRVTLADKRVSAIVLGYWQTSISPPTDFAKAVVKAVSESRKKPMVVSLSGDVEVEDAASYLEQNGIPAVCYAPERAVAMLAAKFDWARFARNLME